MSHGDNTRRDYFVAAAVSGLLGGRNHADKPYTTNEIAEMAVKIANAVMTELEKDANNKVIK